LFTSGKTSSLHAVIAHVTFNLLSFSFIVGVFGVIPHLAFVSRGTYSCNGRVGRTDHSFGFSWVGLEC
jgi:hypothetical protein